MVGYLERNLCRRIDWCYHSRWRHLSPGRVPHLGGFRWHRRLWIGDLLRDAGEKPEEEETAILCGDAYGKDSQWHGNEGTGCDSIRARRCGFICKSRITAH